MIYLTEINLLKTMRASDKLKFNYIEFRVKIWPTFSNGHEMLGNRIIFNDLKTTKPS